MSAQVKGNVSYPVPLTFSISSKKEPEYTRASFSDPSLEDVRLIHAKCIAMGMGENAIVVLRPNNAMDKYKRTSHHHWGIVQYLKHVASNNGSYAPLHVKWFQPSSHYGVAEEDLWPHEVYVVHTSVSKDVLEELFEDQDNAED